MSKEKQTVNVFKDKNTGEWIKEIDSTKEKIELDEKDKVITGMLDDLENLPYLFDLPDVAMCLCAAGYRKQSEWISVDERLPDKKEYDWVLVNVLLTPENYYGVPQIAELRNGKWWGNDDFPLSELGCKVTHWMPLPEAPKMKGGAE